MSRLTDLIRQAKANDPVLGADLEAELRTLSERRVFGLNFERHHPETVELPDRPVRKGDKVRVLPERGSMARGDQRLWRVIRFDTVDGGRTATLSLIRAEDAEIQLAPIEDLVVVAEFRDPIFPGLVSTDRVERGGDKPFHVVINAENFHALQTLLYTHRGQADCIYVDPPYNTGAKDWKYNNDYVDGDDLYRHSKWLAFMERRLLIAKELLNPDDSVLIVTIDEREDLRLGLLLQQTFAGASMQMVSTLINAKGTGRANEFRRVDEYIFFLWFGEARLGRLPFGNGDSTNDDRGDSDLVEHDEGVGDDEAEQEPGNTDGSTSDIASSSFEWQTFRRRDLASRRGTMKGGPRQFYPIYVNVTNGYIEAVGEPLPHTAPRAEAPDRDGCVAVFPVRPDGTEMNWSTGVPTFVQRWQQGYVRAGKATPGQPQPYIIQYLKSGPIRDIEEGRAVITGRRPDGSVIAAYAETLAKTPTTHWSIQSHNAEHYGTGILKTLIPGRSFPFPKSLYAVEDAVRLFVADKPHAVVIDFFAGSGTTAHAVMRLNRQDGGRRQSLSITNNEVSAAEQGALRSAGLRPGDRDWEKYGICEFITKPRLRAAVTGLSPSGKALGGAYTFVDEFPMSEGFEENVEYLTLTYESPWRVARNRDFAAVAPILWLRAGAQGRRIDSLTSGWDVADSYGVIQDLDEATPFLSELSATKSVRIAFIVTDDDRRFQMICAGLPTSVEPVRLYESYLRNFELSWE